MVKSTFTGYALSAWKGGRGGPFLPPRAFPLPCCSSSSDGWAERMDFPPLVVAVADVWARKILDLVGGRGAGIHDEDIVALIAAFNGRGGHDDGAGALVEDETDVDELVERRASRPGRLKTGLELGGAGGGVDLIVEW